jgi:hypothetical protein
MIAIFWRSRRNRRNGKSVDAVVVAPGFLRAGPAAPGCAEGSIYAQPDGRFLDLRFSGLRFGRALECDASDSDQVGKVRISGQRSAGAGDASTTDSAVM